MTIQQTRKARTTDGLIQLLLDCGCQKTKLEDRIQDLITLAYCNSDFIDAMFQASSIAKNYNKIKHF